MAFRRKRRSFKKRYGKRRSFKRRSGSRAGRIRL